MNNLTVLTRENGNWALAELPTGKANDVGIDELLPHVEKYLDSNCIAYYEVLHFDKYVIFYKEYADADEPATLSCDSQTYYGKFVIAKYGSFDGGENYNSVTLEDATYIDTNVLRGRNDFVR